MVDTLPKPSLVLVIASADPIKYIMSIFLALDQERAKIHSIFQVH